MGAAACRQGTLTDTVLGKAKYNIKTLSEGILETDSKKLAQTFAVIKKFTMSFQSLRNLLKMIRS